MKYYDFLKAKQFIEDRKESIQEASLGMHEDWFWTAETVFENNEYRKDFFQGDFVDELKKYEAARAARQVLNETIFQIMERFDNILIGGIAGSGWATPTLQVIYKDGHEEMILCYIQDGEDVSFGEKIANQVLWTSGVLSSEVQANIAPLQLNSSTEDERSVANSPDQGKNPDNQIK